MAATNLGQLSVDIVANIGNLQKGLMQATQLINRFAQQTSKQVQTGAKFMGSQYNKFAVSAKSAAQTFDKSQRPIIDTINKTTKAVQANAQVFSKSRVAMQKGGKTIDRTKDKFKALGGGVDTLGGKMVNFIRFNIAWFATWRLMWGALRAVKAGVAAIIEFDTAITNLGAITGATQEQLIKLGDTARSVGATTIFTAVETADAMVDLSKAGFSVSEVNTMIAGTAKLAIGTLSELIQTTQLMATTLRTFRLQAADTTEVANIFAAAITNSRLTIEGLRSSMKYIGPIMAEIGYSLEDTAAVLGVLADRGLEAGISARGLRGFFSALIAPSQKLRKEIESVGLTMSKVSPLYNDLGTILMRLREANFDVESAMRGLERRVGTIAIALIGAGEYFDILKEAITATTAAEVIAERQTDSLGYRLKLIKSEATEVALSFRDFLLPAIQEVTSAMSGLLQGIGALLSYMNDLKNIFPEITDEWMRLIRQINPFLDMMLRLGGLLKDIGDTKNELANIRIELSGMLFDLGKQRTELARTGIALKEYKEDEEKLRTALRALGNTYPEITALLLNESIAQKGANALYEEAIVLVDKYLGLNKEQTALRKGEYIVAIKNELVQLKEQAATVEDLQAKMKGASKGRKALLETEIAGIKLWGRSYEETITLILELENTLRILTKVVEEGTLADIKHGEGFKKTAEEELEFAKKRKASAKELIPLYDEVIKLRKKESKDTLENLQSRWKEIELLEKQERAWDKVLDDEDIKTFYGSWIKNEKTLATLQMERGKLIGDYNESVATLKDLERDFHSTLVKYRMTEVDWYNSVIFLIRDKMDRLKESADKEGKWTRENASEHIKLQTQAFESLIL